MREENDLHGDEADVELSVEFVTIKSLHLKRTVIYR
jgi:hypothetical protein